MAKKKFTEDETTSMKKGNLQDRMLIHLVESNDEIKDGVAEIKQTNIKTINRLAIIEEKCNNNEKKIKLLRTDFDTDESRNFYKSGKLLFLSGKKVWAFAIGMILVIGGIVTAILHLKDII